tara:strand:+ start:1005 stop:1238 length:234 start_codon:yes stop_codon:yes gene_type:complete
MNPITQVAVVVFEKTQPTCTHSKSKENSPASGVDLISRAFKRPQSFAVTSIECEAIELTIEFASVEGSWIRIGRALG